MLKRRLIPKLQMQRSRAGARWVLVTTVAFGERREIGDPVSQAKIYQAQAADELIFLDITATTESRPTFLEAVRAAAEEIFMPFTVGGGVTQLADVRTLLSHGADKVSVNTAAVITPNLISAAADKFGSSTVVVAIDYVELAGGERRIVTHGGRQTHAFDPLEWAVRAEKLGAGEILLTSVTRDGSRSGLDVELLRECTRAVKVPVIGSGGCGLAAHFVEGFQKAELSGIAAGNYFSFKDENPMQCRSQIANAGIPIRLVT